MIHKSVNAMVIIKMQPMNRTVEKKWWNRNMWKIKYRKYSTQRKIECSIGKAMSQRNYWRRVAQAMVAVSCKLCVKNRLFFLAWSLMQGRTCLCSLPTSTSLHLCWSYMVDGRGLPWRSCARGSMQVNILSHYFLCKKSIGTDNSGTIHLSHHFLHIMHHRKKWT